MLMQKFCDGLSSRVSFEGILQEWTFVMGLQVFFKIIIKWALSRSDDEVLKAVGVKLLYLRLS